LNTSAVVAALAIARTSYTYMSMCGLAAAGLVRLDDGSELAVDAFHVVAPIVPRGDLVAQLGVDTTELPNGTGIVVADTFGATSVPAVIAAGDAAGAGNVAASIAGGSLVATGVHRTLAAQLDR
jgi:thioredoxin reductase